MQICILPIKRTTRKIRRLASAELWTWTTSNYGWLKLEDVGQNADLYIANQKDNTQN